MLIQPAPVLLGLLGQLVYHRERGDPGAASLGTRRTQSDGGECRLNGVGRSQVDPVLGREIIEGEQVVLVLLQAFTCPRVFGLVVGQKRIIGL